MQTPDTILKFSWSTNKTVAMALRIIAKANWPKNKHCITSVLQLANELGWNWRTADKEFKLLIDSKFIKIKHRSDKGVKKLEVTILK